MASKAQGSSCVKVLVVEDNTVQRMVLSQKLHNFQCEITLAVNGKEAVDLFLEGKKFDIIFCDKDMPIMTGPEVLSFPFGFSMFLQFFRTMYMF